MDTYITQLKDVFTTTDVTSFKSLYSQFSSESDDDVNTLLSFYSTYLHPYDKCIFYSSYEDDDTDYSYKLYNWFKKHIVAINDINTWYNTNKANILNNTMSSQSITKMSDTPQDGSDYTEEYPTTQSNVTNEMQGKDNISFLNSLAKKYHNYMDDFVVLFIKECGLYFDKEVQ